MLLNMKLLSQCQGLLRSGRQTSGPELFMTVRKRTRGEVEENGTNGRRRRRAPPHDYWLQNLGAQVSCSLSLSMASGQHMVPGGGTGNPLPDRFLSIYTVTQSDHAINSPVLLQKNLLSFSSD